MIYAVITKDGDETVQRFDTWDEYHAATFSPEIESYISIEVPARIRGTAGYKARKIIVSEYLKDVQYILSTPGLSMHDYSSITRDAERIARRYGLFREARENGVC